MDAEDVYKPPVKTDKELEIEKLKTREKELEDAINKGLQQEDNQQEHKEGNGERQASEASSGNRTQRRKRRQKEG
jgi:hypothetical protein